MKLSLDYMIVFFLMCVFILLVALFFPGNDRIGLLVQIAIWCSLLSHIEEVNEKVNELKKEMKK